MDLKCTSGGVYVPCIYTHEDVPLVEFYVPCIYTHEEIVLPLVEFTYLVFTRMPGESYHRRLRSLLVCLCYDFQSRQLTPLCNVFRARWLTPLCDDFRAR